jgi:hypothetical protein
VGLTVFVPGQYPYVGGFEVPQNGVKDHGAHYFLPRVPFSFGPDSVLESDIYLFAGDYQQARQAIYSLHKSIPQPDVFPPYGFTGQPKPNAHVSGTMSVSGWVFDNVQVSAVDIFLDGRLAGHATYGLPKPDVATVWPHAPLGVGFKYDLDTTKYSSGQHFVVVKATDSSANVAVFSAIPVVFDNGSGPNKPQ